MAEHGAGRKETIQDKLARLAEQGREKSRTATGHRHRPLNPRAGVNAPHTTRASASRNSSSIYLPRKWTGGSRRIR